MNRNKDYCRILELDRTSIELKTKLLPEKWDFKRALKTLGKMLALSTHILIQDDPEGATDPLIVLSKSFVCNTYGIMGFPRFLDGHYLYMIISKEHVGTLLGAKIYQVKEARLEMILNQESSCLYKVGKQRSRETKYLGTFNCLEVNDFYFSYELDLTQNVETMVLQMAASNKVQ